jgi:hypothetical protein
MMEFWLHKRVLHSPIVCQEEKPLTVVIKPAGRVDAPWERAEIGQCLLILDRRKLAVDAKGFVKEIIEKALSGHYCNISISHLRSNR